MTAYLLPENLIEDATTLTADNEATGFEIENIKDRRTSTWWKPGSLNSPNIEYVTINFGSAQTVDCFAFVGHNLGTEGATIELQYLGGSPESYVSLFTITPSDDKIVFRYTSSSANSASWRLKISNSTTDMLIAAMAMGQAIETPSGIRAPISPPKFNRDHKILNNITEGGQFTGRSLISEGYNFNLEQTIVIPSWVETNYDTIIDYLEVAPFFYCYDYQIDSSPSIENAAYCWVNQFNHARYTHNGKLYMDFSMNGKALIE